MTQPDYTAAFASLFTTNMGIQPGERIVVFSDLIRPDESPSAADRERRSQLHVTASAAANFARSAYGTASFVDFPATPASGAEPPVQLWQSVFGEQFMAQVTREHLLVPLLTKTITPVDLDRVRTLVCANADAVAQVVIALANNSTSHTNFRKLACAAGTRFASLPHFDPAMFFSSMQVDWQALVTRTERLAAAVNTAIALEATTPDGTSLRFSSVGRVAEGDTGILTAAGSFGNLPAGEVYLAPVEGSTEGVMVITHAPTRPLATPLKLVIRGGEVVEIIGDEPYRDKLEAKFVESRLNRNIAELGIGTNDRATRPDNVLEAEKILGTIHVALGDNSGFGGTVSTPFHEDYVLFRPTLIAVTQNGDRRTLLADGQLLSQPAEAV
jgi:leucyl aminopeptidase (aminopeptidase T)